MRTVKFNNWIDGVLTTWDMSCTYQDKEESKEKEIVFYLFEWSMKDERTLVGRVYSKSTSHISEIEIDILCHVNKQEEDRIWNGYSYTNVLKIYGRVLSVCSFIGTSYKLELKEDGKSDCTWSFRYPKFY